MEGILFLCMVAFVLFYPPAVLAMACYKSCMRKKQLTAWETISCCIPLYNLTVIRKSFYGSAKFVNAMLAGILVCIIYRVLAILVLYQNQWCMLVSTVSMLIAIALIWIVSAYTFLDTAVCVRQGLITKLCCIFLPPLGAFVVSKAVAPYMKSVAEELDGTFGN